MLIPDVVFELVAKEIGPPAAVRKAWFRRMVQITYDLGYRAGWSAGYRTRRTHRG